MRILVLSLHRIGDFFMHQSLLPSLRKKYKASSVSILLNDQIFQALSTFDGRSACIDELIAFPRRLLQNQLVLREGSIFTAKRLLDTHLSELKHRKFDLCIDLTHSEISRKIASFMQIPIAGPPRDSYLNEFFDLPVRSRFHYLDALGLTLKVKAHAPPMRTRPRSGKVLVQMQTSDVKKNFPLASYLQFLRGVKAQNPDLQLEIIGSASEEGALRRALAGEQIPLNICDWSELRISLERASCLISVDTATIHLAAQLGVWCFGIYLGSADPSKTAPFGAGHILVQSTVPCGPCSHRAPCGQSTHECSEQLTAAQLAETFTAAFHDDTQKLVDLAYRLPYQILISYFDPNNFFGLRDLADENSSLRAELSRCAHGPTASDWNRLAEHPNWQIHDFLSEKEFQFSRAESWLRSVDNALTRARGERAVPRPLLDLCQEFLGYGDFEEWGAWLAREIAEAKSRSSIEFPERIRYFYTKFVNYLTLERQIVKNLVVLNARKGAYYVSGPPGAA